MAKIEDIVYNAIDLNLYDELFKEVTKLRFSNNARKQLYELYEEAFDNVKCLNSKVVELDEVYEKQEEEDREFGDHNICQF